MKALIRTSIVVAIVTLFLAVAAAPALAKDQAGDAEKADLSGLNLSPQEIAALQKSPDLQTVYCCAVVGNAVVPPDNLMPENDSNPNGANPGDNPVNPGGNNSGGQPGNDNSGGQPPAHVGNPSENPPTSTTPQPQTPKAPEQPPATSSKLPNTGTKLLLVAAFGVALAVSAMIARRVIKRVA